MDNYFYELFQEIWNGYKDEYANDGEIHTNESDLDVIKIRFDNFSKDNIMVEYNKVENVLEVIAENQINEMENESYSYECNLPDEYEYDSSTFDGKTLKLYFREKVKNYE